MKQTCLSCETEYENPVGFGTERGSVCMSCKNVEIDTFTVQYSGMENIIFRYEYDAHDFTQADVEASEYENKHEDYTIKKGKMNVLEYYNLEEWDG